VYSGVIVDDSSMKIFTIIRKDWLSCP